jgi:nucleoid-associated protein YgaU
MPGLAPITVRQPQPFDLVGDTVEVCGIGTGFEAVITGRVRDANGTELVQSPITAGANGVLDNFHAALPLGGAPSTPQGTLEVFEFSAKGDGSELNKVVVPITFGHALIDPYVGFVQYTVVPGDSLWAIAEQFYGAGAQYPRLFEANRDRVTNPDLIFPGQVLRVPQ